MGALNGKLAFVTGGALYYLVVSTLAVSAFFLLIDMIERIAIAEERRLARDYASGFALAAA